MGVCRALNGPKRRFPARAVDKQNLGPSYIIGLGSYSDGALWLQYRGAVGAGLWPHRRVAPPLIHFTPDSLRYPVPPYLKREGDRTPRWT